MWVEEEIQNFCVGNGIWEWRKILRMEIDVFFFIKSKCLQAKKS